MVILFFFWVGGVLILVIFLNSRSHRFLEVDDFSIAT